MSEYTVSGVLVEVVRGDISKQDDVEAIVNAANRDGVAGGGVAGAIHAAAGDELEAESRRCAPIEAGQCVITGAGNLDNEHVIHCRGPVYGSDMPSDRLLADCYERALDIAEHEGITSIAFPAISTGAFGYPFEEAADVAVRTVRQKCKKLSRVRLIRFVLRTDRECASITSLVANE